MQEQQLYGDEIAIDLGKYIEVLLRQWRLIVSATLICAFTAGLVSVTLPKQYEARVLVASTKSSSSVSFGSSIQTMSESQLLASGSGAYGLIDREARLESYVQMVKNPLIAQDVLLEVNDQLEEEERGIASLLDMVEGKVAENSDSIEIVVTYGDPVMAATIADLWGKAYVERVNAVYSEGGTSDSYIAVQGQSVEAKTAYDVAQAEYVAYVTDNQKDELNRKIGELQVIIDSLSDARGAAVKAVIDDLMGSELQVIREYYSAISQNQLLALQRDRQGRRDLITTYINTLNNSRQKVFDEHAQDYLLGLTRAYTDTRRVEKLLVDAQDMRDQVLSGGVGAASSNALALTLLKAQVFADSGVMGDLQIQTSPAYLTPEQMVVDLDGLVATLQTRLSALEEEIQSLSDALLNGEGFEFLDVPLDTTGELATTIQNRYTELWETGDLADLSLKVVEEGSALEDEALARTQALLQLEGLEDVLTYSIADTPLDQKVQDLEQDTRDLQAQLAEENDREKELSRARDLAWGTYTTLTTKEAELGVAVQTKGTEVSLASPAAVPDQDTVSGFKNVILATMVGLMLGVGAAYFIEFWWGYKGIETKAITFASLFKREHRLST